MAAFGCAAHQHVVHDQVVAPASTRGAIGCLVDIEVHRDPDVPQHKLLISGVRGASNKTCLSKPRKHHVTTTDRQHFVCKRQATAVHLSLSS
eukprot:SAG11_NODE_196_length_12778_cov_6.887767_9_plen_92_part_00